MDVRAELDARKVGVVGVSTDGPQDSRRFAQEVGIEFSLCQDPTLAVADSYGVADAKSESALPALFVVDRDQTIVWGHVGTSTRDFPTETKLLEITRAFA